MQLLSKRESWDLICRKAFLDVDAESYPPYLKELGEEMVDKCNGLPLAIIVLGGLLSKNMSHIEWKKVHDNINAYLAKEGEMGVMAMLKPELHRLAPLLETVLSSFKPLPRRLCDLHNKTAPLVDC